MLLALSLLASAAAAHAECAWVLWGRDGFGNWGPRTALATEGGCRQEHATMSDENFRASQEIRRPQLARQTYFECWTRAGRNDEMVLRGLRCPA
jgi:hypothetical protein